ncbi:DNA methyltransferase [Streptomyces sp. NPDC102467]|uniref:DNA methyltransferase n=1 Tax=Streptomyces sp. NPDC102467 TaxID=3366179 RepID=UPI0038220F9E
MTADRLLRLDSADKARERPPGARNDIHFTEAQIRPVVEAFSPPGGAVLDPFSGYGTTVVVADRLGRVGTGIELQEQRVESSNARLPAGSPSRFLAGDVREWDRLGLGEFDLCLTSPPYMARHDHPENPLTAFRTMDGSYRRYLDELADVFRTIGGHLRPGGRIAVCVGNFRDSSGKVTPLAFDVGHTLSEVLDFEGEIYFEWSTPSESLTGDYCLLFSAAGS